MESDLRAQLLDDKQINGKTKLYSLEHIKALIGKESAATQSSKENKKALLTSAWCLKSDLTMNWAKLMVACGKKKPSTTAASIICRTKKPQTSRSVSSSFNKVLEPGKPLLFLKIEGNERGFRINVQSI